MTLPWWLSRVSPSILASGLAVVIILRTGFGVPWRRTYAPSIVFLAIYTVFCIGMFWGRKQFDKKGDLRLAVGLFGICSLVTGLVGMWFAGRLGLVSSDAFAENRVAFSVYVMVCTIISVVLLSYWKPNFRAK